MKLIANYFCLFFYLMPLESSTRQHTGIRAAIDAAVFEVHECPVNLNRIASTRLVVETHALTVYGRCGEYVAAPSQRSA